MDCKLNFLLVESFGLEGGDITVFLFNRKEAHSVVQKSVSVGILSIVLAQKQGRTVQTVHNHLEGFHCSLDQFQKLLPSLFE